MSRFCNPNTILQRRRVCPVTNHMTSETSGWYARLDHQCPDRGKQIRVWLDSWMSATKKGQPIAAALPMSWPTLPAGLLSNPGTVLDSLLARLEAEKDGRSPRGIYSTPAKFMDAILYDELHHGRNRKREPPATLSLAALPPSFRAFAKEINENIQGEGPGFDAEGGEGESRSKSGVPLPFADPCVGAGLLAERLLRIHSERISEFAPNVRREDTLRLLEGLQLVGNSEISVDSARKRITIILARLGLIDLQGEGDEGRIGLSEAEMIVESNVRCIDPLRGEWPWNECPMLLVSRPPWLRIKDRFRGHPEGSKKRKKLSKDLRQYRGSDGKPRFSAIKGNVNLYRLYIERSLQIAEKGGRVRLVVPDSVLREKSSVPLRKLMVEKNDWDSVWSFPEDNHLLFGGSQGVAVLGATVGGFTEVLTSFGPLAIGDISPRKRGLVPEAPFLELERGPWSSWTDTSWAVPKMPRSEEKRKRTLKAIDSLSDKPRLVEGGSWLSSNHRSIKVRVGEVDRSSWIDSICEWERGSGLIPFVRAAHIEFEGGEAVLRHPAFDGKLENESKCNESGWKGPLEMVGKARVVCQAIVNPQVDRRLIWVVVPSGCVLSNSVSFLEISDEVSSRLEERFGSFENGLSFLASKLNSDELDLWSKAWAANNNVNNYEIEMLPFDSPDSESSFSIFGKEGSA